MCTYIYNRYIFICFIKSTPLKKRNIKQFPSQLLTSYTFINSQINALSLKVQQLLNCSTYTEIKIMKKYSKSSSPQKSWAVHGLTYFSMAKEPKQRIFQWYIEFPKIEYFSMAKEPKQRIFPWQKSQNNVFLHGKRAKITYFSIVD